MGHHSDEPFDVDSRKAELLRKFEKAFKEEEFRGALGTHSLGKLNEHDEGDIQFGVTTKDGKVVIEFGTSVRWLGMSPQQAADLASLLLKHARNAGREAGETVSIKIG